MKTLILQVIVSLLPFLSLNALEPQGSTPAQQQQNQQVQQQQQFYFRADEPKIYFPHYYREEIDRQRDYRADEFGPYPSTVPSEEERAQEYNGGMMRGEESRAK